MKNTGWEAFAEGKTARWLKPLCGTMSRYAESSFVEEEDDPESVFKRGMGSG